MARKKKNTARKSTADTIEQPELTQIETLQEDTPEEMEIALPHPDPEPEPESTSDAEAAEPLSDDMTDITDTTETNEVEKEYTLRTFIANTKEVLTRHLLPDMLLPRFMSLYFLISGIWIIYIQQKLTHNPVRNWREYVTSILDSGSLTTAVISLLVGFLALSCLSSFLPKKWQITDQSFGILSILFFDCTMLWRTNNFMLTTATMFVSLVFIYYLINKLPSREPYEKIPWTFCGLICLGALSFVTYFIIRGTIAKHRLFGTACHDFGLFVQMFHSMSQGLGPVTTSERDELVSHFHIHASYIYYLLVPIYKIFKKETVLLAAQGVLAMGGAIPMFLIAKRRKFKGVSLIFMTFIYIFSIAIVSPCYYDFHENAFLPTLLMWLFYAIDISNPIFTWIMAALVCIVKEDAPLYIVCIGLFLFFEKKNHKMRWHGLLMSLVSGGYMVFITKWLTANGDGSTMTNIRFGLLLVNQEKGLGEVIRNVILNPAYFFSLLLKEDTLNFFLQVMLPLLFLPFLTKKLHRFWLMVPMIVMNLVIGAGYGYASNIEFHYIFGPVCLLFYMVFLNLEDLGEQHKHTLSILLGSAAILFFVGMPLHFWDNVESYATNKEQFQKVEDALDMIPSDAIVHATPFYVAHCAERDEIYLYDMNDVNQDTQTIRNMDYFDFFVFGPNTEIGEFTTPILEKNGWTVLEEVNNRVVIYQNPKYQG